MSTKYNHKKIERKWAKVWKKNNTYKAIDFSQKPKKYILAEFPYPSGSGLHVGHIMRYTLPDVLSRKFRMSGYNVLFPIGWDAFGLPTENYAIKTGLHPTDITKKNIETYSKQLISAGFGFDWDREINTTDPSYYKWTQWIFLKFFEHGLAELKEEPVWWCENLKTVLANEEVLTDSEGNFVAERDGKSLVEKKLLKQWVLKIPKYAEKLINGLENTEFPEHIKNAQINWIGKSNGAEIKFRVNLLEHSKKHKKQHPHNIGEELFPEITVFTTRLETIFGATFIVLAPEHPLLKQIVTDLQKNAINEYQKAAKNKSEIERQAEGKEKTGVFTGSYAVNPYSQKLLPIWVSDFVLMNYGTGAIMGVPAHDERDFAFAKKFGLEITQVIYNNKINYEHNINRESLEKPYTEKFGILINSGDYDGLSIEEAYTKLITKATQNGFGIEKINYKLRDWLFSRQRYWGEPIPLVHKDDGSIEPITTTNDTEGVNKTLPLLLPDVPDFTPTSDGFSPLAKNEDWVNTITNDRSKAKRETNTMPNWAGSSWYYLRYIDPKNDEMFADEAKLKYWLPVDMYFGGSEHTTLHLLYSRFWHQFLYDLGLVPTPEPYKFRMNGGILLGSDGDKMSKSKGNVLNPDEKIQVYGADALRLYVNFMGPYDGVISWQEGGLKACRNLVEDIYNLKSKLIHSSTTKQESAEIMKAYHKMVMKVTKMIDDYKTNTAVSEFMIFVNLVKKQGGIHIETYKNFLKLLAPFAPFITEEIWQELNENKDFNNDNSIHWQSWPQYDPNLVKDEKIVIGVQVNGKLREEIEIDVEEEEQSIRERCLGLEKVQKYIAEGNIKKFIYIKGKIVNIVV